MLRPADRLKLAREAAGKSIPQLALEAGTDESGIWDLESYDDDIDNAVSLEELARICRACGISMRFLLDDAQDASMQPQVSFQDLQTKLVERLAQRRISVDEFGDEVGWDLSGFLLNCEAAWGWNIQGVRDVANALGVPWLDALPLRPRFGKK